ncbi:FAD-dependent oxidoreductase [Nocardia sp. NPDC059239]|uniref:FAD-dependent oxidoreductase n=1 Tax=unclassified Nocardia TaxID=2637762 RepID=UPI0036948563
MIGSLTLKNRMIMGSMHTRVEGLDRTLDREIAFYRRRAESNIALIISGGFSPNPEGRMEIDALVMSPAADLGYQRELCREVAATGVPFFAQILHAGRYAKVDSCVGPSARRSSVSTRSPRRMGRDDVRATIRDYAIAAETARDVGYAGVELMGSEGYLINQFLAARTNDRDDEFGGTARRRMRFAIEVVRAVRAAVGREFPLIYRISALELVEEGMSQSEIIDLAQWLESEGVDCLNTGIGWHEARVPTVAYPVPRIAWAEAAAALKHSVGIPVVASNRINNPDDAEHLIATHMCDMVSLARPLLADPEFAKKVAEGVPEAINTCIACNQSCIDRIFLAQSASCVVNPRALHEVEFEPVLPAKQKRIAVVGGGVAGMTFAFEAAARGHKITLYERDSCLGGQLQLARRVPDKYEFDEFLRYLEYRLSAEGVKVRTRSTPGVVELGGFDDIIIATGTRPRVPDIPGIRRANVTGYQEVLSGRVVPGQRVVILGTGGIAFDVAEYLLRPDPPKPEVGRFHREYGVEIGSVAAGGIGRRMNQTHEGGLPRTVVMTQRSGAKPGRNLGVTTMWIKRERLRAAGLEILTGVSYSKVGEDGLHIEQGGVDRTIEADTVINCTGQEPRTDLVEMLATARIRCSLIGGARDSSGVDIGRAVDEATRLAVRI